MEYVPYGSADGNEAVGSALSDLASGQVDLMGPLLKNAATEEMFEFPENSYGTVYTTLVALAAGSLRENNLRDRDVLRVGLWQTAETRNGEVLTYLKSENLPYEIVYYDTAAEQQQALVGGAEAGIHLCPDRESAQKMIADGHYDAFIGAPLTSGMCAGLGFINSAPAIQAGLAYAQHPTKSGGDPGQQTIAMVKGLEEQIPTEEYGTVLLCDNSKACVEAVEAGKADVAAGTWAGLEYYIYETGSTLVTSLLPGQNMDADIAVSRDCDTQLLAAMNNYIYSISEDELAGYLSTGNLHPDSSSVLLFARRYPVQAMMAVTAVTALVAAIVVCLLLRASRQRAKMQAVHNRQLSQALQIARDANEAKTTFLSNMSHDIRTPMNAVIGFSTLLAREPDNAVKVREYARKISAASNHLLGLINDILDISKIESGKLSLRQSVFSLDELMESVNIVIRPMAGEKKQSFQVNMGKMAHELFVGDKTRVNQVLINLLSNAIKYTPVGGSIRFEVTDMGSTFTVELPLRLPHEEADEHFWEHHNMSRILLVDDEVDALVNSYIRIPEDERTVEEFGETPYYIMARKEDQGLIDQLDYAIDCMNVETPNWRTELYNQYYGSEGTNRDLTAQELELLRQLQDSGEIIRGVMDPDSNPYAWYEGETARGIAADIFKATADRLGLTYEIVPVSTKEEYQAALDSGSVDVWMDMDGCYEDEGGNRYKGTDAYLTTTMSVLRHRGAAEKIERLVTDDEHITVKEIVSRVWPEAEVTVVDSLEQCREMVLSGQADAALLMSYSAQKLARDDVQNRLQVDIVPGAFLELRMGVNANDSVHFYGLWEKTLGQVADDMSEEVVQRYEASAPDEYFAVFMDMQMPVMDGVTATRLIRQSSRPDHDIPIFAMTANTFASDRRRCREAGMNGYIPKPVSVKNIEEALTVIEK